MSRRCSNGVIDPVFRRLNNSLFPDKDLFRCCGCGCSVLLWTSLTAGQPVPPLLSLWLGRRCSSGQFLLSAVISGFPLSPLNNYFSRLLPLWREAAFYPSLFLSHSFHCSAQFVSPCLFPPSHPTSPIYLGPTASQLEGILCRCLQEVRSLGCC